jgi:MFS family permease
VGWALAAGAQTGDAPAGLVVMWALALFITGAGVGMAWPHLSAWAMSRVDDRAEGPAAAAAINTVQLICGAFGAGLAGMIVNLTESGDVTAARWLFTIFAVFAAIGAVASFRARAAGDRGQSPTD